jgi:MFS family permease
MADTISPRAVRGAQRWVKQSPGLGYVTPEAFGLLARRIAARYGSALWGIPFAGACVVILASASSLSSSQGTVVGDEAYAKWGLVAYVLIAIGGIVTTSVASRAERRIGRSLPHRVSRGTAVSIPSMLGRSRTAFLAAALSIESALAVTLLAVNAGWFAWAFLLAVAIGAAMIAVGLWQASTRPTVAVDPVSLAIDERFRSSDAFHVAYPMIFLMVAFPSGGFTHSPSWLQLVWLIAIVALCALLGWGVLRAPWGWELSAPRSIGPLPPKPDRP